MSLRRAGTASYFAGSYMTPAFGPIACHAWLRDGWLVPIRAGAFCVGGRPPSAWQRMLAVSLCARPGVTLSHAAALFVLSSVAPTARPFVAPLLVTTQGAGVEVKVVRPRQVRMAGVTAHRVAQLDSRDVWSYRGVDVTNHARAVVDIAERVPEPALARLIAECCALGLFSESALMASAQRVGRPQKLAAVRRSLGRTGDLTESPLEDRMVAALDAFRPFEVHHRVEVEGQHFELDIAWPELQVAAEGDGYAYHGRVTVAFRPGPAPFQHVSWGMTDDEIRRAVWPLLLDGARRVGMVRRLAP